MITTPYFAEDDLEDTLERPAPKLRLRWTGREWRNHDAKLINAAVQSQIGPEPLTLGVPILQYRFHHTLWATAILLTCKPDGTPDLSAAATQLQTLRTWKPVPEFITYRRAQAIDDFSQTEAYSKWLKETFLPRWLATLAQNETTKSWRRLFDWSCGIKIDSNEARKAFMIAASLAVENTTEALPNPFNLDPCTLRRCLSALPQDRLGANILNPAIWGHSNFQHRKEKPLIKAVLEYARTLQDKTRAFGVIRQLCRLAIDHDIHVPSDLLAFTL